MVVLVDCITDDRYAFPAKAAAESAVRLLLADSQQELLTVYTDGFRVDYTLEDDDTITREYVVHGEG